jgi:hypothetical protein
VQNRRNLGEGFERRFMSSQVTSHTHESSFLFEYFMRVGAGYFLKFYTVFWLCWYSHWSRFVPTRNHDVNTRIIILTAACINDLYLLLQISLLMTGETDVILVLTHLMLSNRFAVFSL